MDNNSSIFIVEVMEDDQKIQYEYSNLPHAREHYNSEESAMLLEYNRGDYYFVDAK